MTEIEKPDILAVIEQYVDLKKAGQHYRGLCPFHSEKTPSFMVNPLRETFHCFGCGTGGDVFAFITRYLGLSFKEALQHLGIDTDRHRPNSREIRKRELIKQFNEWCNQDYDDFCAFLRILSKAKRNVRSEEDLSPLHTTFYHEETLWLARVEIFLQGTTEEKFDLYKEIHGY